MRRRVRAGAYSPRVKVNACTVSPAESVNMHALQFPRSMHSSFPLEQQCECVCLH